MDEGPSHVMFCGGNLFNERAMAALGLGARSLAIGTPVTLAAGLSANILGRMPSVWLGLGRLLLRF